MDDCSKITKFAPTCTPKKWTNCPGKKFSIKTSKGCKVSGTYKNVKGKQSVTAWGISASSGDALEVSHDGLVDAVDSLPAQIPDSQDTCEKYGCSCIPDYLIYWGQLAQNFASVELPCVCLQTSSSVSL